MIPNNSEHIVNRLLTKQGKYCSVINIIIGVYFIERMKVRT